MKISLKNICLAFLATTLLLACKKTSTDSPALEIIPEDAAFVVSIDYANLVKKGKLNDLDHYSFLKNTNVEINDNPAIKDLLLNVLKNPSSSGLNLEQFYIFGISQNDQINVFASFNVEDQKTFEKNLKILEAGEFVENKSFRALAAGDRFPVAWNSSIATIALAENPDLTPFFETPTTHVTSNISFADNQAREGDVRIWLKYGKLLSVANKINPQIAITSLSDEYKNLNYSATIAFNAGEIKLDCYSSPKAEVDRLQKLFPLSKADFNDRLLADFPEQTYLLLKYAINPKAVLEYLKITMDRDVTDMLNEQEANIAANALAGDFIIDIHGFAAGFMPIPNVSVGFSVHNEDAFNSLLSLLPPNSYYKMNGYYSFPIQPFISVMFAYKDGRALITSDAQQIEAFAGKGLETQLKNNATVKRYSASPNLFYLNLNLSTYPGSIQMLLKNTLGVEAPAIINLLNRFDYLCGWQADPYTSVATLKFTDLSKNSLQTLLEIIDDVNSIIAEK